jgi:hypothetical protein
MAKLDGKNAEHVAMALAAAELTVSAQNARTLLLAGDLAAEQPTVRLENSARRARDDLKAILTSAPGQSQEELIDDLYGRNDDGEQD